MAELNFNGKRPLRLPLTSAERIRQRDAKLLEREMAHAIGMGKKVMRCQCSKCMGTATRPISTVQRHLEVNGRYIRSRVLNGQWDKDSSDEEWERNEFETVNNLTSSAGNNGQQYVVTGHRPIGYANAQRTSLKSLRFADDQCNPNSSGPADETRFADMLYDIFHAVDASLDDEYAEGVQDLPRTKDADIDSDGNLTDPFSSFAEVFKPLYEGTLQTTLEFVVLIVNLCTEHRVPQVFTDAMLALLSKKVLPKPNNCPQNWYHAKRIIDKLGLNYENIDACKEGCVLFRGEFANSVTCPKCTGARYKGNTKIPVNRVRWFPLVPRLRRMFRCPSISALLTWAPEHTSNGGLVHHAADSNQWKFIDEVYPEFAKETRNLRFGMMLDGVNPFQLQSVKHSMWPIMLVNYGLPPWLATKRFFVMLSVLISGPKSITQDNIDVYLAPLYEELHELWEPGVDVYDCHARNGSNQFKLRAMLIWTINDYPALGYISGLCTGGNRSCVVCGGAGPAERANKLGKSVHVNHRKWLPPDHPWRTEAFAEKFNGFAEFQTAPHRQSASHIQQSGRQKEAFDQRASNSRRNEEIDPYSVHGVKRCSALFLLPYWKHLPVRHCIDVMHMEKNVCESLMGFLLGIKDTKAVRDDLEEKGIRPELWAVPVAGRQKHHLPQAPYSFTEAERDTFMKRLKAIKAPEGYCGNWAAKVELGTSGRHHKLFGLKSHDYHVLMQQLLPTCIHGLLSDEVRNCIVALSSVFRRLCQKEIDLELIPQLKMDAVETLCRLEMTFPPAFFDVMTHLLIHAVEELEWCGPVQTRWMYFGERALAHFTRYSQTRANVGGSIARCYVREEALGFMTEYMANMQAYRRRIWDEDEELEVSGEVLKGKGFPVNLTGKQVLDMHHYVLQNRPELEQFRREYAENVQGGQLHSDVGFAEWLPQRVLQHYEDHPHDDPEMLYLSRTPPYMALSYKHMWAYGSHYRVKSDPGQPRATYDAGLSGFFQAPIVAGSNETREVQYVGELTHIFRLDYKTKDPVIIFKARWVRPHDRARHPSFKIDNWGLLHVNFKQLLPEDVDPYVFPSVVNQVFFLEHEARNSGWRVVMRADPRSLRLYHFGDETQAEDQPPQQRT